MRTSVHAVRRLLRRLNLPLLRRNDRCIRDRMLELEAETRRAQARLHEITSIVAGLASATQLMPTLQPADRRRLESAVTAELRRLTRLLSDEPDEVGPVDIDEVVGHLVSSHRARGRTVTWTPTGLHAIGRCDEIAEAINVLLENAARHGSPDHITIDIKIGARADSNADVNTDINTDINTKISTGAATAGDQIRIAVSDHGPGVRSDLSELIFEWGGRRPDSPGHGIGLFAARQQLRAAGGDLGLEHRDSAGACFVITLPAAPDASRGLRDSFALAG